ncbi:MAG: hypothetical protein IPP57_01720 [Candidatus Obscuribacter sp.]|nr:hypothetical protein [Candidatus Obscuribacter sp.]
MSLGLYLKGRFAPAKAAQNPESNLIFDRPKLEEFERWISNVAFEELEWSQWTEDDEGLPCLMMLCIQALSRWSRDGAKFHLAMPFDGHQFDVPQPILTQLGPRDSQWLTSVIEDPTRGNDIFPWWEDGHGAEYHLGRALCYMWNALRWREPLTEAEAELLESILQHLDSAYGLDPDLAYPWREWDEIIGFMGANYELSELIEENAEKAEMLLGENNLIGYRRKDVRKNLGGGWSVALPGTFVEEMEEGQTFLAYDETKNVRVTCMSASDNSGQPLSAEEILHKIRVFDDPMSYERGRVLGRAFFEKLKKKMRLFGCCAVFRLLLALLPRSRYVLRLKANRPGLCLSGALLITAPVMKSSQQSSNRPLSCFLFEDQFA